MVLDPKTKTGLQKMIQLVKEKDGRFSAYLDQPGRHYIIASDLSDFNMRNFLARKGYGKEKIDQTFASALQRS